MEQSILMIEEILGRSLPKDFRAHLLSPDRDCVIPAEVEIPDEKSLWVDEINILYSATEILARVQLEVELIKTENRDFPTGMLPFGDNEMGDYYLISLRQSDFGSLYFMFHETCHPLDEEPEGLYLLDQSFSHWMGTLKKLPSEPESDWEVKRRKEWEKIIQAPAKPWWKFW